MRRSSKIMGCKSAKFWKNGVCASQIYDALLPHSDKIFTRKIAPLRHGNSEVLPFMGINLLGVPISGKKGTYALPKFG